MQFLSLSLSPLSLLGDPPQCGKKEENTHRRSISMKLNFKWSQWLQSVVVAIESYVSLSLLSVSVFSAVEREKEENLFFSTFLGG